MSIPTEKNKPGIENPETPPENVFKQADLSNVVDSIESDIDDNLDLMPENTKTNKPENTKTPDTQNVSDDWKKLPLENYETNASGEVKLDANGKPKRRGGRPKKLYPGCKLAGGGVHLQLTGAEGETRPDPQGDSQNLSRVVDLASDDSGTTPTIQTDDTIGEDGGRVIVEAIANVADGLDEKIKPTNAEKSSIERSLSKTLGGLAIPAWMAATLFFVAYLLRVRVQNKPQQPEQKINHAQANIGQHENRKVVSNQTTHPGFDY